MQTIEISKVNGIQSVTLPKGFQFESDKIGIRREGDAVILEPIKGTAWPAGFFESIRIDDPAFARPEQGKVPRIASLE